jgi:hypothetical protein
VAAGDTIRLLTRHNVGSRKDPRENRLTAAVVALLTDSPLLARCVARKWIQNGAPDPEGVEVRFQRPVGGNVGWVDLELDVRGAERTLIWRSRLAVGLAAIINSQSTPHASNRRECAAF